MSEEEAKVEVVILTQSLRIDGEVGAIADLFPEGPEVLIRNARVYDRLRENKPLYTASELYLNPDAITAAIVKESIEKEGVF